MQLSKYLTSLLTYGFWFSAFEEIRLVLIALVRGQVLCLLLTNALLHSKDIVKYIKVYYPIMLVMDLQSNFHSCCHLSHHIVVH